MDNFKTLVLAAFMVTLFLTTKSRGQDDPSGIVKSLNEVIVPITTMNPDSSFSDLAFLKKTLAERSIVSLGEATHGTKEFFVYKDRLIRFMVTELGFNAIAFESDFSTVQRLDDYINHKVDKLSGSYSGFPLLKETRSMLSWLRQYNQTRATPDRVHLYGIEARGFNTISASILASLNNLTAESKALLTRIRNTSYSTLTKKDIKEVQSILPQLYQEAELHETPLTRHYVTLLDQDVGHFLERQFGKRDKYMAANVSWILEQKNTNKMIIWAHNGHLSKSSLFGKPSMGTYLYEKYKSKYFTIATDFSEGFVHIAVPKNGQVSWENKYIPAVTTKNNYEYYFQQCKSPNFIIDISSLKDHQVLTPFFSDKRVLRMVGATGGLIRTRLSILENFDLIVFIKSTQAI
ncbi:erythromycin esterase-like protein [Pedobacter sp. CAN_A7]|uniref:erythromycin esterase family protein n=1 Tax=Pedobacter sp. CAN_A7 TaxID=2787722 RepID=UPI0018C931F1